MAKQWSHELIAGDSATKLRAYAVRLPDGSCPGLDWLTSLTGRTSAAAKARLDMFAQRGWLRDPDAMRQIAAAEPGRQLPAVHEIKHVGENLRIYVVNFAHGTTEAFITHGSLKPKPKRLNIEIDRARDIYTKGMTS